MVQRKKPSKNKHTDVIRLKFEKGFFVYKNANITGVRFLIFLCRAQATTMAFLRADVPLTIRINKMRYKNLNYRGADTEKPYTSYCSSRFTDEYRYGIKRKQIAYKSNLTSLLAGKNGVVKFSGGAIVCGPGVRYISRNRSLVETIIDLLN